MTTNKYFNNGIGVGRSSEQDLAESSIIETIQMSGHDFLYIPRTIFNPDKFFNEVPNSSFDKYHVLEMYMINVTDFDGQGDLMSKFGLQIDDTLELLCSRKRFLQETGIVNPSEGDLIYFPLSKHLFEIDFVEDEAGTMGSVQQFYTLSKLYTFAFKCSLYKYSYEEFDLGYDEIDDQFDPDIYETEFERNDEINEEGRSNLDFSESNPFGDTTYIPTEEDDISYRDMDIITDGGKVINTNE